LSFQEEDAMKLESLLLSLLPKLLDFLRSDQFQQLVEKLIAGLEKLLDSLLKDEKADGQAS